MADKTATDSKPNSKYESALSEYNSLKLNEPQLDLAGLQKLKGLADTLNSGPEDFAAHQAQKIDEFKTALTQGLSQTIKDPSLVSKLADKAAQRFIVQRQTGEQSLVDYLAQEGKLDPNIVRQGIGDLHPASFIPTGQGDFANEVTRLSGAVQTAQDKYAAGLKQANQDELAANQRQSSADIFGGALKAFQTPLPTYTPELSEEVLRNLQQGIVDQGDTAYSKAEAGFANRGLAGSSIEAFGLGKVQGDVAKQFADSTLNFLLNSGASAQQNRNLLASQLFQQSQSLLNAGQGSGALAVQQQQGTNQLQLQQDQLAAQIAQFNKTYSESQRQFDTQQQTLKDTGAANLALLMQQLSQPKQKGSLMPLLGIAGAGLGAAFAAPTGGLSLAAGAAIGGAAGATSGGLFDYFGGQ